MKYAIVIIILSFSLLTDTKGEEAARLLIYRKNEVALQYPLVYSDPGIIAKLVELAIAFHAEGQSEYDKPTEREVDPSVNVDYVSVRPVGRIELSRDGVDYRIYFSDNGTPIVPPLRLSKCSASIAEFRDLLFPQVIVILRAGQE